MTRTLRDLDRKSRDLKNGLGQIRAKEKYQHRQIEISSRNLKAKALATSQMGDNQLKSIKEVLQGDSKEIANLVNIVNSAKKDLAV